MALSTNACGQTQLSFAQAWQQSFRCRGRLSSAACVCVCECAKMQSVKILRSSDRRSCSMRAYHQGVSTASESFVFGEMKTAGKFLIASTAGVSSNENSVTFSFSLPCRTVFFSTAKFASCEETSLPASPMILPPPPFSRSDAGLLVLVSDSIHLSFLVGKQEVGSFHLQVGLSAWSSVGASISQRGGRGNSRLVRGAF